MDGKKTFSIVKEKTIEECTQPSSMRCRTAVMDGKKTVSIVKEKTIEECTQPGYMAQLYTPIVKIKEELQEDVNHEFFECPLKFEKPDVDVNGGQEPNLHLDASRHNCTEASEILPGSTHCIKEEPELILDEEETEIVGLASESDNINECDPLNILNEGVAPSPSAPDSTRLLNTVDKATGTVLEETTMQRETGNKLETTAEKLPQFIIIGPPIKIQLPVPLSSWRGGIFLSHNSFATHFMVQSGTSLGNFQCGEMSNDFRCSPSSQEISADSTHKVDFASQSFTTSAHPNPQNSNVCVKSLTQPESLHEVSITRTRKRYSCDFCGKIFLQSSHLERHARVHTGEKPHICNVCGKSFRESGHLKRHTLVHSGEKPHKCNVCERTFYERNQLRRHTLIHTGAERPYKCNICGKAFIESRYLKQHSFVHTKESTHKCGVCGKCCISASSLEKHCRVHTGEKPYTCHVCGKSFGVYGNLKNHFVVHAIERPHKCDVCGKSFKSLTFLKKHKFIHTGKRPHKCKVCGKTFPHSSSLKVHNLVHTGEKPHECRFCGKRFTTSTARKTHIFLHTGERPHKCNVCQKAFTTAGNLRTHSLIHMGKKPHKCDVCGKSFTEPGNLKKHSVKHTRQTPH